MKASKPFIVFFLGLSALSVLVLYGACSKYHRAATLPAPVKITPELVRPSASPTLNLFLDQLSLAATRKPLLVPSPLPFTPTAVPQIIKEISKFDLTVDDKKRPILHYQFVGEGTPKPKLLDR